MAGTPTTDDREFLTGRVVKTAAETLRTSPATDLRESGLR